MERMVSLFILVVWLISHVDILAQDVRSTQQVMANTAHAMALEHIYETMHDSILRDRTEQYVATLTRVGLKYYDLVERQNLRNFRQENRTYQRAKQAIEQLVENVSYLLRAARKNPQNFGLFYKNTHSLLMTATESVGKMIRLAMNSQVALPPLGGAPAGPAPPPSRREDGANLLTSAERVQLMEDVLWELRWLSRAVYRMAVKLDTDVAWTIFFKSATPTHYRKVNAILQAQEYAIQEFEKLHWF